MKILIAYTNSGIYNAPPIPSVVYKSIKIFIFRVEGSGVRERNTQMNAMEIYLLNLGQREQKCRFSFNVYSLTTTTHV
jgi:hypothetical protein